MFAYLNGVFPGSFVGIGTFCGSNLSLDHESGCIAMCKNPTVLEHASFHAAQYPSYQLDRDMPGGKCRFQPHSRSLRSLRKCHETVGGPRPSNG